MTLPASGTITLHEIAAEFGIAIDSVFPTAFYGKGGAPASGPLSFADFYGRSGIGVSITPSTGNGGVVNIPPGSANYDLGGNASASGGSPSSYLWGVQSTVGSGTASVTGGGTTANATLRITPTIDSGAFTATFYCDMVIAGVTYRANCTRTYTTNSIA